MSEPMQPKEAEGEKIALGGQTYIVPPLCIDQLRLVVPAIRRMAKIGTDFSTESIDDLATVVYISLSLNYPELSKDQFRAKRIGLEDLMNAVGPIAKAAGLKWVTRAEAEAKDEKAGEAGAGQ